MQLTIDLSATDEAGARKAIAMIQTFYGIESDKHAEDDAYRRGMQAARNATAAASVPSVANPFPLPADSAPSTVAVVPSPTAPVVAQVSSPEQASAPQTPAVPTVPAATAPTAPAALTTHASGVAIDKAGLPWDARIHSSSKAIKADGTWRKRNGLNDDGLVKRIEAELMAAMAVPAAPAIPAPEVAPLPVAPIAPATEMPAIPSVSSVAPTLPPNVNTLTYEDPRGSVTIPIPAPLPVPVAAPTALPSVPAAAIPTAPPTTLPELMPRITGAMMTGTLPGTALLDAVKSNGIPDLPTLAHRPDLIPQVWATLQATYPGVLV